MKKLHTKERGITLISLVITIIILLILAGITISSLMGNGLLEKSKLAKEESKRASIIEYINLKLDEISIDNYDKDTNKFMEIANSEFKKDETKRNLQQYGKEVTISDIVGQEDKLQFYITIDNKIYEVQKTGVIYKGENTEVDKPSIEVLSGMNGENGYYRSDVELKITQINTENLYKIKYKLKGAMITEEKEIENGGIINITEEGTTTVIAASYDYTNNKSEEVELEIKKDSIAPEIKLEDANPSAREYSKKVIANITDSTSNIQSQKYAYNTQEINYFRENGTEFSNNFNVKTQDEECATYIEPLKLYTVYAKDEAGNESVKTISLPNLLIDNILTTKNGLCAYNGVSVDDLTGSISFPSTGGTQYGPFWELPGGTYEITYTGNNLSNVEANYSAYVYEKFYGTIVMQTMTSNTVTYRTTIPENAGNVEFTFVNVGKENVIINNIRIKQL